MNSNKNKVELMKSRMMSVFLCALFFVFTVGAMEKEENSNGGETNSNNEEELSVKGMSENVMEIREKVIGIEQCFKEQIGQRLLAPPKFHGYDKYVRNQVDNLPFGYHLEQHGKYERRLALNGVAFVIPKNYELASFLLKTLFNASVKNNKELQEPCSLLPLVNSFTRQEILNATIDATTYALYARHQYVFGYIYMFVRSLCLTKAGKLGEQLLDKTSWGGQLKSMLPVALLVRQVTRMVLDRTAGYAVYCAAEKIDKLAKEKAKEEWKELLQKYESQDK